MDFRRGDVLSVVLAEGVYRPGVEYPLMRDGEWLATVEVEAVEPRPRRRVYVRFRVIQAPEESIPCVVQ